MTDPLFLADLTGELSPGGLGVVTGGLGRLSGRGAVLATRRWWRTPAVVARLAPFDLYLLWRVIPLLNP